MFQLLLSSHSICLYHTRIKRCDALHGWTTGIADCSRTALHTALFLQTSRTVPGTLGVRAQWRVVELFDRRLDHFCRGRMICRKSNSPHASSDGQKKASQNKHGRQISAYDSTDLTSKQRRVARSMSGEWRSVFRGRCWSIVNIDCPNIRLYN